MARQEVNKAQREDRGLEPQAAFQGATYWWDQRRKCSPVTWAWITAFAPHPCHGQFLVIQTRTGEKLSDKPWSLLCDKISSRFLRAKRFGYQAFLKKSSCTLVPTVPGETKLTVLLSFRPNQEGRCEGKQWGNKSLPPNQKVPSCSLLKVDRHHTWLSVLSRANTTAPATAHGVGAKAQYESSSMVFGSTEKLSVRLFNMFLMKDILNKDYRACQTQ